MPDNYSPFALGAERGEQYLQTSVDVNPGDPTMNTDHNSLVEDVRAMRSKMAQGNYSEIPIEYFLSYSNKEIFRANDNKLELVYRDDLSTNIQEFGDKSLFQIENIEDTDNTTVAGRGMWGGKHILFRVEAGGKMVGDLIFPEPLDLSTFNGGVDAMTNEDRVFRQMQIVTHTAWTEIAIRFCTDDNNYFELDKSTGQQFGSDWNSRNCNLSLLTAVGSPDWSNITKMQFYGDNPSTTAHRSLYINRAWICRSNGSGSNTHHPFGALDNTDSLISGLAPRSGSTTTIPTQDEAGVPCIITHNDTWYTMPGKTLLGDCFIEVRSQCPDPPYNWVGNTYIQTRGTLDMVRVKRKGNTDPTEDIEFKVNNVVVETITVPKFTQCKMRLVRTTDRVHASVTTEHGYYHKSYPASVIDPLVDHETSTQEWRVGLGRRCAVYKGILSTEPVTDTEEDGTYEVPVRRVMKQSSSSAIIEYVDGHKVLVTAPDNETLEVYDESGTILLDRIKIDTTNNIINFR